MALPLQNAGAMKTTALVLLLIGCHHSSSHVPPDVASPPDVMVGNETITIDIDKAPNLVAFREGLAGPWQPATMVSAMKYQVVVHGPYIVAVACEQPGFNENATMLQARVPADANELMFYCDDTAPVDSNTLTGHMVQAGQVYVGDVNTSSMTPNWTVTGMIANGTFDLFAVSADHAEIRRNVTITGDTTLTPQIDVVQQGTALSSVALTATNGTAQETVSAMTNLQSSSIFFATVYRGPLAAAKVMPESMLVASDKQSVSVRGLDPNGGFRADRRKFSVGDSTSFALPPAVTAQFAMTSAGAQITFGSLPFTADYVDFYIFETPSTNSGTTIYHDLDFSSAFVTATGATQLTISTDIPGYQPNWKIDERQPYDASFLLQSHATSGDLLTSSYSQSFNQMSLAPVTPRAVRRSGRAEMP